MPIGLNFLNKEHLSSVCEGKILDTSVRKNTLCILAPMRSHSPIVVGRMWHLENKLSVVFTTINFVICPPRCIILSVRNDQCVSDLMLVKIDPLV